MVSISLFQPYPEAPRYPEVSGSLVHINLSCYILTSHSQVRERKMSLFWKPREMPPCVVLALDGFPKVKHCTNDYGLGVEDNDTLKQPPWSGG